MSSTTVRAPARPSPRRWWADVAGSAALASVVVVLALWLSHGGVRDFRSPGGPATALGRVTGLVSADLLVLQVLLMARIPWVERFYGQDRLARRHRLLGFGSFWLMVTHVVLIAVGYALDGGSPLLSTAWGLVTTYPGMLLATAGTALLVVVVALSVRAARRRQRYETWHLIHLYAYLGVGLALPHQLWTGADFAGSAVVRFYWWGLYAAAAGAVLLFRLGLPAWRSVYHRLRVDAVVPEAPGVVSVYLRGHRLDRLPVRAGQFFLWRFLDGPGWSRAHPYTLSAGPRADLLRITVKRLGDGSARVARLRPGTRVLIEGPYGALTAARHTGGHVLLIAAGVGITTMRALLDDLSPATGRVTLLYRIRRYDDAVFRAELNALARRHGVRIVYLDGARRDGSWLPTRFAPPDDVEALRRLVPAGRRRPARAARRPDDVEALRRLVPDVAACDVFLCGPPPWMRAVRDTLASAGVAGGRVHAEEFAW